jgi:hypothetical protein
LIDVFFWTMRGGRKRKAFFYTACADQQPALSSPRISAPSIRGTALVLLDLSRIPMPCIAFPADIPDHRVFIGQFFEPLCGYTGRIS